MSSNFLFNGDFVVQRNQFVLYHNTFSAEVQRGKGEQLEHVFILQAPQDGEP